MRQTAAQILAAAACDLFPHTLLFQGEGTEKVFFYDFLFPFTFQTEFLPLLEERMRQIVRGGIPINCLEMVPASAAALLEQNGQPILADKIRQREASLVRMVQVGNCVDWCEFQFASDWKEAHPFKLLEFYPIVMGENTLVRIVGVVEEDKEALKKALKMQPIYRNHDHIRLVQEQELFMPTADLGEGVWSWLPKANEVKQCLEKWWWRAHLQENFQLMTTPSCLCRDEKEDSAVYLLRAHRDFWEKKGGRQQGKIAEISYCSCTRDKQLKNGLFDSVAWITDRAHLFVNDEQVIHACISSLQFITRIPKILNFDYQIVLYTGRAGVQKRDSKGAKGYRLLQNTLKELGFAYVAIHDPQLGLQSRIQLRIPDALGRWWDGPFIGIDSSVDIRDFTCIVRSAFNSLERLVALYVEKYQGKWPFWLSPEQVRIIVLADDCYRYAKAIRDKLEERSIRVSIDEEREAVKTRLHRSFREHIPCVALIGEHEKESSCVSYRTPDSLNQERKGVEQFINMIVEMNRSKNSEFEN